MTAPHVDQVGKCQICSALIEHYAGEPEDLWHHVEVPCAPEEKPAHDISTRRTTGGVIEVTCSCGKWSGIAPAMWVADRDAQRHRLEATA